ncbi:coilin [Solea solea]|uniref:coilin n=1 Tax=Solea solea TaxID=90069 RepID=UPI00272B335D|nr:coilin [Solea solea]
MAANSNSFIRVRLFFDYPPPAIADCRMCWLLVDLNACRVVSDLESLIREKFEFSSRSILNLFVDDCYLPHTESVFVVRDNDSVRVKVDSLAQVNGHSSCPDTSSENCRKRHRPAEDDGVSVEWKEKKRKKKREESLEREAKQASDDKKSKKSKDKHAEKKKEKKKKKKKKKTEDNIPAVTPKPTAAAKKPPSTVEQPVKSIKKLPAVQGKTQSKKQTVSSSDSSSSSSEEQEAPKKIPALKPAPKTPSSTPATSKTPVAASKTPVAASKMPVAASKTPVSASKTPVATKPTQKISQPTPSSSSETDSSSDEADGAKVPPKHKPWNSTSQNSKPQQAPSLPPSSDCAQKKAAPEATPPPDGKDVETPKSDEEEEEEEIQLVIRQPLQQPWRGMGGRPPWSGGSCGRTGSGGLGGRGRGEGRGLSRGHTADSFESSYNGAKEPCYQTDLLSNKSVILQNRAELAPKKDYSSMPLLAAPPQVGQKIAFKLLELTENYTPEVSEYKEGRIISFDPTTKQIGLEILTVTQAHVEPGKFDLVYQNADGSESVEYAVPRGAWVTERWDSLLEPRLLM